MVRILSFFTRSTGGINLCIAMHQPTRQLANSLTCFTCSFDNSMGVPGLDSETGESTIPSSRVFPATTSACPIFRTFLVRRVGSNEDRLRAHPNRGAHPLHCAPTGRAYLFQRLPSTSRGSVLGYLHRALSGRSLFHSSSTSPPSPASLRSRFRRRSTASGL